MKSLLSTALAATIGAIAFVPSAFAATTSNSGTISISGKVVADTCTITVNGSGNTVTLPTVTTSQFTATGQARGPQGFTVNLANCDNGATGAQLSFKTGTGNATDGNLTNTGTAQGVEVQLLAGGTSGSAINVTTDGNAPLVTLSNGTGSTSMTAQYYSTAASVGAGSVTAAATVTFAYN